MLQRRPKTRIRGAIDKDHEWRKKQGIKRLLWLFLAVIGALSLGVFLSLSPTLQNKKPVADTNEAMFAPLTMEYTFYEELPRQQFVSDDGEPLPMAEMPPLLVDDVRFISNTEAEHYVLQIRSYDNAYDADQKRAQVMMAGVLAYVIRGLDQDGTRVYQVVSEPLVSDEQALIAYERLRTNGIDSVVIQKKHAPS